MSQGTESQRSSSAVQGGRRGVDVRHVFPLLQSLESNWPSTLVLLGVAIEVVQLAALIINHWFPWGGIISGASVPIYFSILPFWDQQYPASTAFTSGSILLWVLMVTLLGLVGASIRLMWQIAEQLDRVGQHAVKIVVHSITGVFFLPSLHILLAYSVCDQGANYLTAFPDKGCFGDGYTILLSAAAILGMATLVALRLVSILFLFDDHPGSLHYKARPHNVGEIGLLVLQVSLVVLYHFMPSSGMSQAFAGLFAFGCFSVAVVHSLVLPFYRQAMNVVRVTSLLVLAYAGMLACVLLENEELPASNPENNWNSLILLAGGFMVGLVGYGCANLRVSRASLKDLDAAMRGEHSASKEKALFPANLPEEERTKYRENEAIALGEARFARTQESLNGPQQEREELRDELWVCSPFLDAVHCVTDVEVATRHVHLWQHTTGLRAPAPMVAMGIRIYSKGLSKYPDTPWLELQFASYLCTLSPQRNQVALALCDRVSRNDAGVDFALAYRATRRAATISSAMFIRDNSHKKGFVTAQTMHKEALINMKLFWGKLLADQVDIVQLGSLAKVITDRREEGLKCYERVVSESTDTNALIRYAQFLEQVMMDNDAANHTRDAVLDSIEQEQMGAVASSVAGGAATSSRDPSSVNPAHHQQQGGANATIASAVMSTRQRTTSISRSRTISSLNRNINVIFTVLFCCMAGLLIFGIVMYTQKTKIADKMQAAGMCRGLSQEMLLYVDLLSMETSAAAPDEQLIDTTATSLREQLTAFRQLHVALTYGEYKTSYQEVVDVFSLPRGDALYPSHGTTRDDLTTMGLWELGLVLISAIETIVASTSTDGARGYAITTVRDNVLHGVGRLYNASLEAYTNEATQTLRGGEYAIAGLYVLLLTILFVVYFVLILNFRKISSSKLSTLSLFTLIPKNALEKLMFEGKTRIDRFDMPDETFEALKEQRGLEDDEDAMQHVADDISDSGKDLDLLLPKDPVATVATPPAGAVPVGGGGGGDVAGTGGDDEMDLHGKFASLLRNSTVGDTGKMKIVHHGQYEAPYTKDQWLAIPESAEEVKERQRLMNELHVDEDLRMLQESSSLDTNGGGSSDATEGDRDGKGIEGRVSTVQVLLSGSILFIFALLIVLGALFVVDYTESKAMEADRSARSLGLENLYRYHRAVESLRQLSETVLFAPSAATFDAFHAEWVADKISDAALVATYNIQASPEYYAKVFEARRNENVLFAQLSVLMRVTCDTLGLVCASIQKTTATWDASLFVAPAKLLLVDEDQTIFPAFSQDALSFMTAQEKLRACRRVLSSQYYTYLKDKVAILSGEAATILEEDTSVDSERTADAMWSRAQAEVAIAAVLIIVICATLLNTPFHLGYATQLAGLVLLLLLSAGCLAVAAPRCVEHAYAFQARDKMLVSTRLRFFTNETISAVTSLRDLALRIVYNGNPSAAMRIEALGGLETVEKAWVHVGESINPNRYGALADAFDSFRLVMRTALIASALGCSAYGIYAPPALNLWWNFTAEPYGPRFVRYFPTQVFYTDRTTDLAKTSSAKISLGASLLLGPMQTGFTTLSTNQMNAVIEKSQTELTSDIAEDLSHVHQLSLAGLLMSFGGVAVTVVVMIARMFHMIDASNINRLGGGGGANGGADGAGGSAGSSGPAGGESSSSSGGGGGGPQREDELFEKLTKHSQFALILLALLLTVLFIFTIVDLIGHEARSHNQNAASMREFHAIRSYAAIQQGLNQTNLNHLATASLKYMLTASDSFYFGRRSGGGPTIGKSTAFDANLFGPTSSAASDRYDCALAAATTVATNETVIAALHMGVDLALRRWFDVIKCVNVMPREDDRLARIKSLEEPFNVVLTALRSSTLDFTDASKSAATTGLVGFMVILGVTTGAAIVLFYLVFRPMIGQLLNEEEGTKVMLKMIPAEVRESVPAIAEYLETGVVMQDMKVHEINEAAADLSTIPTITIDGRGKIVKFSRAAEDAFLWTKGEAVGANVNILMPENIAAEHDSYLARYRKTGHKTIINRLRKIRAKRKDGSLFPAEILVREVRNGRSTVFVGTLRNISVEIEFERAIVLSKAVSEAATVPIVVINHKGVILRFNAAAEEAFKCGQEVVGRKVNALMPIAEAEVHDQYLDRYLKTGIKTVIDMKRHVRAKKLNGELFPVRLNIRELKRSGTDPIFIGYVEDMTKQVHLQMASMVSEAIMATSPVPLVAIDDMGIIISWSPAAQHTFGIQPQDALGKNVKTLMLDAVAQRHDMYLQTYQKTGRKKMIGNVTLQKAKRREEDGTVTTVPVRIAVKDIVQQGRSNYFVAFIQDVSKQQHLETEYKISSSITNLSTLPLVTIDELGVIQSFSAAAEVCFGWSKLEAIGRNVTMLMPESYREGHDANIQRYLTTGVRTVIDTIRMLQGFTKDGRTFPIELMVREVKHEGRYNFVGYIRDVSNDFQMAEANAYGDAISQLAVVPVLCIGLDGIIMACSESTCDRFLWSREELVGQNISVLMPDSIGTKHGGFLQNYKHRLETLGVDKARESSSLLHKERQVTARTRDEQHFQCAVHVRDLHIDGMPPMFVGYLRDITDEVNQTIQKTIADGIVLSSSIPLICINTVGTVTLFSKAAEKDFGFAANEILGKNLKMIMPDEVAIKHDGYLRSYVKTGIKNVIDSRRQVVAKKKNGTLFAVEIMVKEVVQKDATGRDHVEYIGFVRDLTQQFILLQANTINDVVSQLATVPIVIINIRGQILDFNAAAAREFGYSQEEALNKNVKMLMPDEIAAQHDGYLVRYRSSRKKTIIDSTRRLTAKRRNGDLFPCEISVREVIKEGTEGQYIGYIRDVSHEQLLAQQHRVNSAIIDLSTTPIIVIDIKGEISIFSRAAEEVFGYDRKEVEGQNVKMLMPQEIASVHDQYLAAYATTGKKNVIGTSRRIRALRKRGTTFPAELSVREIHGNDGQNIFIGYLLDCTEESVLSAAAAFSECINSLSPIPIIAINHIGTIMRFSTAAEEEFRVSSSEAVGSNIKSLQPQEVAEKHDEYLSRYLRTGKRTIIGTTRAVTCKRWDGTTFRGEITTREVKDQNDPNALPNFVGYLRNIEDELQIEEAFREGNAMMELAPIPILSISLRGTITEVNPAAEIAFGYTKSEMVGKNVKMLMPPSIADQHDGYLERYLRTRQKNVIDTIRQVIGQRKNGAQFHVEIAVREIHVEGMENMYIGYVKDITGDLKMAESVSLNEAVNSLSATPLVVIDPVGSVLKVSQAAEDLFGYSSQEIIGKNVKTLMPQSIAIKHDRYLEQYRATGKKGIIDSSRIVTAIRKDETSFACEIGVREVMHNDGKTTAVFVGYIRNLDEATLQVGRSAEVNAVMMDLAVQGVVIIDRFGTVERVNDALLHMLRIPDRSAIVGKNVKLLMPDAIAEQHDAILARYYETREKHIIDSFKQTQGKEWGTNNTVPLEVAVREIIERGKEIRYLGYIRRIDRELEIQTAKKTSAAALDLSPYATVVIDAKGTVLMFSRAAESMFETTAKEVLGKNVKLLMPLDIAAQHDEYLSTYRRTGEKHVVDSARVVNAKSVATGRQFTVQLQIKECTFSIKGLESVFVGYISFYPS